MSLTLYVARAENTYCSEHNGTPADEHFISGCRWDGNMKAAVASELCPNLRCI